MSVTMMNTHEHHPYASDGMSYYTMTCKNDDVVFILAAHSTDPQFPEEMFGFISNIFKFKRIKKSEAETLNIISEVDILRPMDIGAIQINDNVAIRTREK